MNEAFVDLKTTHLLRSVLNEVLNGFTVEDLDDVIGMKKVELKQLVAELDQRADGAEISLDVRQTTAYRNALRETLLELGVEEFQSRTGTDFEAGRSTLRQLNELLNRKLKSAKRKTESAASR